MKTYVSAKVHGVHVTDKSVEYHGSVSVDADLLGKAGIDQYQQVTIVNLSNGQRWDTYAIAGAPGEFRLNGGGARLGEVGDACVVLAYELTDDFSGANVVFVDRANAVTEVIRY